jgi:hypothetical protein
MHGNFTLHKRLGENATPRSDLMPGRAAERPILFPRRTPGSGALRRESSKRMREVGVLLIAFAPLDAVFSGGPRALRWMLLCFSFGVLLFIAALVLERTRFDGP